MANVKTGVVAKTNANVEQAQDTGLKVLLTKMEGQIAKALPSVLTPERYTRMVMTALSTNPDLRKCTPESFLGAVMQAAQLGLEPNTPLGQAYLIPFRNKGRLEVQFQLGYKAYLDLAYRSGEVSIIDAQAVRENDEFDFQYGLEPKLKFKPALKDRGEVICYYAMFKTRSGGFNFLVMSKEDIQNHAKQFSQSYGSNYSPWKNNFDMMAKKTVLKAVLKYAPLKSEFVKNIATDETIKTTISKNMVDVNDETDMINVTATPVEETEDDMPIEVPFGDEEDLK